MHSHRAAQGVIYADMLQEQYENVHVCMSKELDIPDYNKYDEMYVYHGNDWGGGLNLFGGMTNYANIDNVIKYSKFKGEVYSLMIDHPKYSEMLEEKMESLRAKDREADINPKWFDVDFKNLKRIESTAITVTRIGSYKNLVCGDSHAISMYRRGWDVNSVPFKTLHGALEMGLETFVTQNYESVDSLEELEFYFGNIDLRHHLCRQKDPEEATRKIARKYYAQLSILADKGPKVSAYELLPIENESRVLPKTGMYKGTPFHGSWEQRNAIRLAFKDEMMTLCSSGKVKFNLWVDRMINDNGELDFAYMEKPKSIHLSRDAYPHWQGRKYNKLPETEVKPTTLDDFFN